MSHHTLRPHFGRQSLPSVLPSSGAFDSPQCGTRMPLSCVQRSRSCWRRTHRAGPSCRDEIRVLQPLIHRTQERRWVTTNFGPARSEPGPSQAPVKDIDAETHFSLHLSLQLACSNRPEGRLLLCLDPPSTQTVSLLYVRRASISVQGPPLRLSLSPRVFTKFVVAALVPLREAGIHVLNDWLILAQSRALLCEHRDTVLSHPSWLGLQVNWEKSKLSPVQRILFLGMELDSVNLTARLSLECA